MTDSQFACPHCKGTVKVVASMSGSKVRCPLCTQVFQVPKFPADEDSSNTPPSPTVEERLKFACPQCTMAFQVATSSLGQAVACPSCKSPVQLPSAAEYVQSQTQSITPPTQTAPVESPVESLPSIVPTSGERTATENDVNQPPADHNNVQSVKEKSTTETAAPVQNATKPKTVDDLLPPKFTRRLPQVATNAAALDGVILHEPVRKVQAGEGTRSLVVVSDEVKARRRMIRNTIMFGVGSLLLIVAAKLLIR